jgi:hypothetical protein
MEVQIMDNETFFPLRIQNDGFDDELRIYSRSNCDDPNDYARRLAWMELAPAIKKMRNEDIPDGSAPGRTIRRSTISSQDSIARSLMTRFANERVIAENEEHFPFLDFAQWLLSFPLVVDINTFKKYRHCVVQYLSAMPGPEVDATIGLLSNSVLASEDDELDDGYFGPNPNRRHRKHMIKNFPIDDFAMLIKWLRHNSRSREAGNLADLLEASIITGLRPVEWKSATLKAVASTKDPYGRFVGLFVANAKATNNRGNGQMRTIVLSNFEDRALLPIIKTIDLAKDYIAHNDFEKGFRERYIKMMYRVTCQLWRNDPDKGYSLMSSRHQASANWKAELPAGSVSALLGHAVPATSARWYGQPKNAWAKKYRQVTAIPDMSEVQIILERVAIAKRRKALSDLKISDEIDPADILAFLPKPKPAC